MNINDFPSEKRKVAIGNPPFGSYNQLSIKFFNSCSFCDFIAFILPISFEKDSIQRQLNRHFFLIKSSILPKNSFLFQGQDYNVSCVFQIWEKRIAIRNINKKKTTSSFFEFTKNKEEASCSLRRVGVKAGTASLNKNYQLESNYFLINKTEMSDEQFVNFINSIHYNAYGIGPKSLSKAEFIQKFEDKMRGAM